MISFCMKRKRDVWAIPEAKNGFFPIGESNPVLWFLEDYDTGERVTYLSWKTKGEAEAYAKSAGHAVMLWSHGDQTFQRG